jgi:LemA protein
MPPVVWILLAVVVLLVIWGVSLYNGLIALRNKVEEGWRQIDVELKRRHDLIPNLVETVKGYATHERGTLEEVMRARSSAMAGGQSPAQAAQSEGMLSQALGRLIAVSEAYPDLKANQNFQALQAELTSTEDRIASSRRYYNALVRDLNTKVESVPTNFIANTAGIKRAEYFETSAVEAQVPNVNFGNQAPGTFGNAPTPPVVGGPSTQPGAVGGPSTQPGQSQSASGLPQAQAPNPNVDRTTPNE